MSVSLKELYERKQDLFSSLKKFQQRASEEELKFSAEDRENWDQLNSDFDQTVDSIQREERMLEIEERMAQPRDPKRQANRPGFQKPPQRGQGYSFKDLRTGREIRALTAAEPVCEDRSGPEVGEVLYGLLTGQLDQAGVDVRDVIGGADTQGGYLLSPRVSTQVIDLARSASVALRAGAQTIPMDSSELALVKVDTDPTPQWLPEGVAATVATPALGRLTLKAKTLRCHVPVSIELLEDSSNAAKAIQTILQRSLGQKLDEAILVGSGANEPLGISNNSSCNTITSFGLPAASTNDWSVLNDAVRQVLAGNYNGELSDLSLVWHPIVAKLFDSLQDTTYQPLNRTPWMAQLREFNTTTMGEPATGDAIVGDFRQVLIGMRYTGVRIAILDGGTTSSGASAVDSYSRTIVAALRADAVLLQPSWFSYVSGITSS